MPRSKAALARLRRSRASLLRSSLLSLSLMGLTAAIARRALKAAALWCLTMRRPMGVSTIWLVTELSHNAENLLQKLSMQ